MKEITCGLYLISKHDRLLICHPTGSNKEWSIPKGKMEEGEKSFDTAVRETFEETGIKVDFKRFAMPIPMVDRQYKSGRKVLKSFVMFERKEYDGDIEDFECHCDSYAGSTDKPEMDDYRWVTVEEARNVLHEAQVENLEVIRRLMI